MELATEAFRRMGYQVDVVQINWEKKKELVESGEIDCITVSYTHLDVYKRQSIHKSRIINLCIGTCIIKYIQ